MAILTNSQLEALKELRDGKITRKGITEFFLGNKEHHVNTIYALIKYGVAKGDSKFPTHVEGIPDHDVYRALDLIGQEVSYLRKGKHLKRRMCDSIRIKKGKVNVHFPQSGHWVELDYISNME